MDIDAPVPFTSLMPEPQPAARQHASDRVAAWHQDRPGPTVDNAFVVVHSEWNGWRNAMVRLVHLEEIRWIQPTGAPRPLIHAHVNCTDVRSGDLQHECETTSAPHRLLVCVLKSHSAPSVFAELARRASSHAALGPSVVGA